MRAVQVEDTDQGTEQVEYGDHELRRGHEHAGAGGGRKRGERGDGRLAGMSAFAFSVYVWVLCACWVIGLYVNCKVCPGDDWLLAVGHLMPGSVPLPKTGHVAERTVGLVGGCRLCFYTASAEARVANF